MLTKKRDNQTMVRLIPACRSYPAFCSAALLYHFAQSVSIGQNYYFYISPITAPIKTAAIQITKIIKTATQPPAMMRAIVSLRMAIVAFTASTVALNATYANLIAACAARLSIIAAF